jgi:hypothetical protein
MLMEMAGGGVVVTHGGTGKLGRGHNAISSRLQCNTKVSKLFWSCDPSFLFVVSVFFLHCLKNG